MEGGQFIKMSDDIFSHDSGVICLGKKTVSIPTLIKLNILKSEMDIYFEYIAHLNISFPSVTKLE